MKLPCRFFSNKTSDGIVLIIVAVLAMVLANLDATRGLYCAFLNMQVEFRIGVLNINKNMLLWINDALMAVFSLLVGLEVKRELVQGALASRQCAILPAIAAFGGMVVPALIYLVLNYHDPITRVGWAIPVATDVAFAIGVLTLLGRSVPIALKIFLMALAIIDDLGAIIIIAIFYTSNLSILSLIVAAGAIVVLALLNIYNLRYTSIYSLVGAILWIAVLKSGVHATLAGIIVGFFIPLEDGSGISPAKQLEHILRPWVTFMILPLFVFANAGISLYDLKLDNLNLTLPLGIIAGLFIGKPLGISLFCWLALKFKLAMLPSGTTYQQIMAVGVLCGIGFTMSIFIANLAFKNLDSLFIVWAKLSILIGSLLAAFVGYILLQIKLSSGQKSSNVVKS